MHLLHLGLCLSLRGYEPVFCVLAFMALAGPSVLAFVIVGPGVLWILLTKFKFKCMLLVKIDLN